MSIAYCPYELKAKNAIQHRHAHYSRKGALLKFTFGQGQVGYADCHPWEELGDLPLNEQLRLLTLQQMTPLTLRAKHFAAIDAHARSQKKHLFEGLALPMSHLLIGQLQDLNSIIQGLEEGFTHFKIKIGNHLARESELLKEVFRHFSSSAPQCRVRLDFNLKIDKATFVGFLKTFESQLEQIDFYEDPFTYDLDEWNEIEKNYQIQLACDESLETMLAASCPKSPSIAVLKPAVLSEELLKDWHGRTVVTSYLDHPIGQLAAAYCAATLPLKGEICGLHTHRLYAPTAYSEQLSNYGPSFRVPEGTGFGYDELLSKSQWISLTNDQLALDKK